MWSVAIQLPVPPTEAWSLVSLTSPILPLPLPFPTCTQLKRSMLCSRVPCFYLLHKGWPFYQVFHLLPHNCPLLDLFLVNMSNARVLVMPSQVCHAVEQSWVCIRIPCGIHFYTNPKSCPRDSDPVGQKVGHCICSFTQLPRYSPELEKDRLWGYKYLDIGFSYLKILKVMSNFQCFAKSMSRSFYLQTAGQVV